MYRTLESKIVVFINFISYRTKIKKTKANKMIKINKKDFAPTEYAEGSLADPLTHTTY